MMRRAFVLIGTVFAIAWLGVAAGAAGAERATPVRYLDPIELNVPRISTDRTVKYDYDIVYVRAPRHGDRVRSYWAEIAHPTLMEPGADLMLLHPDGSEEVLVKADDGCS